MTYAHFYKIFARIKKVEYKSIFGKKLTIAIILGTWIPDNLNLKTFTI